MGHPISEHTERFRCAAWRPAATMETRRPGDEAVGLTRPRSARGTAHPDDRDRPAIPRAHDADRPDQRPFRENSLNSLHAERSRTRTRLL
jgi:hypothetical protein